MISDHSRNHAFDGAISAAVRRLAARNGRAPRVLDIGSGSGLLALMAARAGATVVHSLEMVPALAHVARHIVSANGYGGGGGGGGGGEEEEGVIRITTAKSTDVQAASLGGAFDLLVCEIVDDMLLGEGVLTSIADARRRLLHPAAAIIPRAGAIFTLAVELRPPPVAATESARPAPAQSNDQMALDDHQIFLCDLSATPEPLANVKLQHIAPGGYRALAPPLRLFAFDWAACEPADALCAARSVQHQLRVTADGILSAMLIYFTLDLDGDPAHAISSGPENPTTHWEQNARWLPHELRVRRGEAFTLTARHDDHHVSTVRLANVKPHQLEGMVGHPHLVGNRVMQDGAVALDYATQ